MYAYFDIKCVGAVVLISFFFFFCFVLSYCCDDNDARMGLACGDEGPAALVLILI